MITHFSICLWFPPTAKVCNCAVNKTELDIKRTDNNRDKVTVHPGNLPPIHSTDFSYDAGWLTWTVLPKCKIFVYSSFLKSLSWNNVWICGKWALLVILKKKKVILKKKKKILNILNEMEKSTGYFIGYVVAFFLTWIK